MSHNNSGRLALVTTRTGEAQRGEEIASHHSAEAKMGTQVCLLPREEFLLLTLLGLWHQEKEHDLLLTSRRMISWGSILYHSHWLDTLAQQLQMQNSPCPQTGIKSTDLLFTSPTN